jgi:hypothetical protein
MIRSLRALQLAAAVTLLAAERAVQQLVAAARARAQRLERVPVRAQARVRRGRALRVLARAELRRPAHREHRLQLVAAARASLRARTR